MRACWPTRAWPPSAARTRCTWTPPTASPRTASRCRRAAGRARPRLRRPCCAVRAPPPLHARRRGPPACALLRAAPVPAARHPRRPRRGRGSAGRAGLLVGPACVRCRHAHLDPCVSMHRLTPGVWGGVRAGGCGGVHRGHAAQAHEGGRGRGHPPPLPDLRARPEAACVISCLAPLAREGAAAACAALTQRVLGGAPRRTSSARSASWWRRAPAPALWHLDHALPHNPNQVITLNLCS